VAYLSRRNGAGLPGYTLFVVLERAKGWARSVKRDVVALWIACRDPRVPWYAKVIAGLVAAFALSPIDLIPDFVPVLGYVDDLLLVPAGILLAVRLIPAELMEEFRATAASRAERPTTRAGAAVIVLVWLGVFCVAAWWFWPRRTSLDDARPHYRDR
jgi:uncharacterized membrane protein YkvA (DUF1232 family)